MLSLPPHDLAVRGRPGEPQGQTTRLEIVNNSRNPFSKRDLLVAVKRGLWVRYVGLCDAVQEGDCAALRLFIRA